MQNPYNQRLWGFSFAPLRINFSNQFMQDLDILWQLELFFRNAIKSADSPQLIAKSGHSKGSAYPSIG